MKIFKRLCFIQDSKTEYYDNSNILRKLLLVHMESGKNIDPKVHSTISIESNCQSSDTSLLESSSKTQKTDGCLYSSRNKGNISNKDEDIWLVKSLTADFQPNFKRSSKIDHLERVQKEKCENFFKEMAEKFQAIVVAGNQSLTLLAETAQGELAMNSDSISNLDTLFSESFKNVNESMFEDGYIKLRLLENERNRIIEEFHEEAKTEMNKQLEEVKKIVTEAHFKMEKIGLISPQQKQAQFENSIMDINKTIMENHRTYVQLKLHLQLNGNELISNTKNQLDLKYNDWVNKPAEMPKSKSEQNVDLDNLIKEIDEIYIDAHQRPTVILYKLHDKIARLRSFSASKSPSSTKISGVSSDRFTGSIKPPNTSMADQRAITSQRMCKEDAWYSVELTAESCDQHHVHICTLLVHSTLEYIIRE